VVATGGGAFMYPETRALFLARCTAIWLDGEIAQLAERASRSGQRPLLKGKDPHALLSELAAARNPIYAEAHIHIAGGRARQDQTVDRILAALRAWSRPRL
jgi:shikimate kinase